MSKTKTQITLNKNLSLIVDHIMEEYPIYDVNQSIEFLIAKGSKDYLDEMKLSFDDLKEIEISRKEIQNGQATRSKNMKEAIASMKE